MKKLETVKDALKYIKKKGDIQEAVAHRRNTPEDTTTNKILKTQIFIFSRILYLAVKLKEQIKNQLTSVEKAKKAQDIIRKEIDAPIDIIRMRPQKNLAILLSPYKKYITDSLYLTEKQELITYLKKINDFAQKYDINTIYVQLTMLSLFVSKDTLSMIPLEYYEEIFNFPQNTHDVNKVLATLDQISLEYIIKELEIEKYDIKFLIDFQNKIKDKKVIKALDDFFETHDANELLSIVRNRLNVHLNEDNIALNRHHEKELVELEVGEKFIKYTMLDNKGKIKSQNILSLYGYLGVNNYHELKELTKRKNENQEINLISCLYFYLFELDNPNIAKAEAFTTLYDAIYKSYIENPKKGRIPWIKNRIEHLGASGKQYLYSLLSILYLLSSLVFIDIFSSKHPAINTTNEIINDAYGDSWELEENLYKSFINSLKKLFPKNFDKDLENYIDKQGDFQENKGMTRETYQIADIDWFSKEEMPEYFAAKQASNFMYEKGEPVYLYTHQQINPLNMQQTRPMFQIKMELEKDDFKYCIEEKVIEFADVELYPIDKDFVLTSIYIVDKDDPTKVLYIDNEKMYNQSYDLSEEDISILSSIERPLIHYIFGLKTNEYYNPYYQQTTDTNLDKLKLKSAILKGLDLDESASLQEIVEAITTKKYVKKFYYPETFSKDEYTYWEKVASQNEVDIDLALYLVYGATDDLTLTVGFRNENNDDLLTQDEAYVWLMNEDGLVIDIIGELKKQFSSTIIIKEKSSWLDDDNFTTDSEVNLTSKSLDNDNTWSLEIVEDDEEKEEKLKQKIKETFEAANKWSKEHKIPLIVTLVLITSIIYLKYGEKILFHIRLRNTNKYLSNDDVNITFAKLLGFIYNEDVIPIERTKEELIDIIYKELYCLKDEDIKELLTEINDISKNNCLKVQINDIKKLLKKVPFIIENREELKNSTKKLVL